MTYFIQDSWLKMAIAVLSLSSVPLSVLAEQPQTTAASSVAPPTIGPAAILNFGTSLVVVIAAILLIGFLYSKTHGLRGKGSNVINIVASRALGPKEKIVLIEVADKQLVLGMTASQVQTLHVFDERVVDSPEYSGPVNFAERLAAAIKVGRK